MTAEITPVFALADRRGTPAQGTEVDTLLGFLDHHRDTFRAKTSGLTAQQLQTTLGPSDMTLGGMIKHLALVDLSWLTWDLHGDELPEPWADVDWDAEGNQDWDWHSAAQNNPIQLSDLYEESVRLADDGIDRAMSDRGLETRAARADGHTGEQYSLRWILVHLIEEYARHNGHADLIRQSIDGVTGE